MLVKIDKDYLDHRPAQGQARDQGSQTQAGWARHDSSIAMLSGNRSTTKLAADARLLLRADHERRRLEGDARQVCARSLPYVNHRNDLTYVIGEMIGELNNGHAYVGGGERPETPRIKLGLLGAELSRDPASKAYRIDRILPGENWEKDNRVAAHRDRPQVKPATTSSRSTAARFDLGEYLRRSHRHGRQTGDSAGQLQAERRRCTRCHGCPDRPTSHSSITRTGCRTMSKR